ncbi:MAG: hypothetical protein ACRCYR_05395 [Phycicoccus sp.]
MTRRMPPAHLPVLLAGALLAATGLVVTSVLPLGAEVEFGWFAYAPGADAEWPVWVLFRPQQLGALAALAGAVLVAGALGYRLALRRHAPHA